MGGCVRAAAAQAADRPSAWGWAVEAAEPLRLPPAALGLLSQVSMGCWGGGTRYNVGLLKDNGGQLCCRRGADIKTRSDLGVGVMGTGVLTQHGGAARACCERVACRAHCQILHRSTSLLHAVCISAVRSCYPALNSSSTSQPNSHMALRAG